MTGGGFPDGIKPILEAHRAGRRDAAIAAYERWLPLINIENRQCGFLAAKALMKEGGVIACEAPRHPTAYALNLLSNTVTKIKPNDPTFTPVAMVPGPVP
jgi:dihydrodipicolinate synthase/N-acetylneuraminate lyase